MHMNKEKNGSKDFEELYQGTDLRGVWYLPYKSDVCKDSILLLVWVTLWETSGWH